MRIKNLFCTITVSFVLFTAIAAEPATTQDRLRDHVRILASDSLEGRGIGTEGMERAREYIIQAFADAGIMPLTDEYLQPFRLRQTIIWADAYNIVGWVEGSDPALKDEYIVIGAHYDHLGYASITLEGEIQQVYPGADDNASGVAAIIELGRHFAEHPEKLGRSLLIIAFDAEEVGLRGSRHFVHSSPVEMDNIKKMFSLDMVGMYEANNGVHLRGVASLRGGEEVAGKVAAEHGVRIRNTGSSIARRTDTAPFGDVGIPATHVFTGTKSPYHKPEDTYEKLDFEGMLLIHNYMIDVLSEMSKQPQLEAEPSLLAETSNSGSAIKAGLLLNAGAGYHRYPDEFFDAKSRAGFAAGVYLQLPLSNLLSLQGEALYEYNGSKIAGGNFYRHAVTLPLNLQLGTPRNTDIPVRAYFFGGAYYRHSFAGKSAGESLDFESVFRQDEWGYSFGLGVDIFRFTVGYTNRRALTGLVQDDIVKIMDTNNYFTLGYRF